MRFLIAIALCSPARADEQRHLSSDDFTRGASIVPYTLPWWHPEIQAVATGRIAAPRHHPRLDNNADFQRFIRANTGESHRVFDGRNGYLQRPDGLPGDHPNCDNYFVHEDDPPEDDFPTVYFHHPDIHDAYSNGERLPPGHPSVSGLLQKVLPRGHPDVDDLFLNHVELPEWHPDLSLALNDNPIEPVYVFSGHPNLKGRSGKPEDDHPSVHGLFEAHLPESHPDIDELIREGYSLPSWHPNIGLIVRPRPFLTSPGLLLDLAVAATVVSLMVSQSISRRKNFMRTMEVIRTKNTTEETSSSSDDSDSGTGEGCIEAATKGDRRRAIFNPNEERVLVYKEKKSSWKQTFGKRHGNKSRAEVVFCILYVLANAVALWISPFYDFGAGFGSLSAGNTVVTFMTAAKNSIFTWGLQVAFDHMIAYHRLFGGITIVAALAHACFYIEDIVEKTTEQVTLTGLVCLGCGVVIVLSSLNYVRRNYFNVFLWLHCGSFLGFLGGLYLHAQPARPYVIAAVGCFIFDKTVQMLSKIPQYTTSFTKMNERTVHVQFAKAPFSSIRKNRVGQYVFVNFPSLSLKEWHPFSVASGPNDPHIDIYIKALGDHTKKIVDYAGQAAALSKQVKVRVDGPYGTLPFNYRRYGSLLFVAGGIGITPILGILRDVYGDSKISRKVLPAPCIKHISVVWIMPHAAESSLFLDLLTSFHLKSLQDPHMPSLKLSIHVTRESGNNTVPGHHFLCSKPQFNMIMDECVENKHESQTSMLVYACGPNKLVHELWDASMKKHAKDFRVDFYHENFSF